MLNSLVGETAGQLHHSCVDEEDPVQEPHDPGKTEVKTTLHTGQHRA